MDSRSLAEWYLAAKERIVQSGYAAEIDWQEERNVATISESDFLREAAWVVLNSGMRERTIRGRFQLISGAFREWGSAREIIDNQATCWVEAMAAFKHERKIGAILAICRIVNQMGFEEVKRRISTEGVLFLRGLPYIGPVTSYHLAKNLGLDVVKPDRHLVRIASVLGYAAPRDVCTKIRAVTGDRLSVIDLVIWRYASTTPGYLSGCLLVGAKNQ